MDFILELGAYLLKRKAYWLIPAIIVMAIFGGLIIISEFSVISPFIYTLF